MNEKITNTIRSLEKNNFEVIYCENAVSAKTKIFELLQNAKSISRGGSKSVDDIGIIEALAEAKLPFRDYKSPEDRKASILAEYYLTSSNAVTETGCLVNIDGAGNRIAALSFGPEKIVLVVGTNKIAKDVDDGLMRIRKIAAPLNAKRLNRKTPCVTTNECVDCNSDDRICRKTHIITKAEKGRFKIFLVNENLGF